MKELRLTKAQLKKLGQRVRKYGLEAIDFVVMWKQQGGCCAICRKPFKSISHAQVEHSHKKEEGHRVRGLACWWCNMKFLAPLERGGIERLRRALVHFGWRL